MDYGPYNEVLDPTQEEVLNYCVKRATDLCYGLSNRDLKSLYISVQFGRKLNYSTNSVKLKMLIERKSPLKGQKFHSENSILFFFFDNLSREL
jgi:hypothetical protein